MSKRLYILFALLFCLALPGKADLLSLSAHKDAFTERSKDYFQRISMTPEDYEITIRQCFRDSMWIEGKKYLDAANDEYGNFSVFCYLYGRYYLHYGDRKLARRYLLEAIRDDKSNTEALELLVKIETEVGNYSTAIAHIDHLLIYNPYSIRLWRKKIDLYRRIGNNIEANRLLDRISNIYPDDDQLKKDVIYLHEQQLLQKRKDGDKEAQKVALRELINAEPYVAQHYLSLVNLLVQQGRNDEALAVAAEGVSATKGNRELIRKRVGMLMEQTRYPEAECYLKDCIKQYGVSGLDDLLTYVEEETANAAYSQDAYVRYQRLYDKKPLDETLDWLIRTSMQRGYYDDAEVFIKRAIRLRGEQPALLAKLHTVYSRQGATAKANAVLERWHVVDPNDKDVADQVAVLRLASANEMMKEEMYRDALVPLYEADSIATDPELQEVIDRRIKTCEDIIEQKSMPSPEEAWLAKSRDYEKQHNWDSAYACNLRYHPGPEELHEFQRHRYTLFTRLTKNTIGVEYQLSRRSSLDELTHNAWLNYSHKWEKDALTATVGYAGRENSTWTEALSETKVDTISQQGGTGIQLAAAYEHAFTWGSVGANVAWANKFFPKAALGVTVSEELPMDWLLTERLSWRYIMETQYSSARPSQSSKYSVFNLGVTASWTYEQFFIAPQLDLFLIQKNVYVNGGFKFQYFPLDGDKSNVFISAGVGNAPEVSLLDKSLPVQFAHINSNVSAGGFYLVNGHLGLGGSLSWYVLGNNNQTVRNYFYLNLNMQIYF